MAHAPMSRTPMIRGTSVSVKNTFLPGEVLLCGSVLLFREGDLFVMTYSRSASEVVVKECKHPQSIIQKEGDARLQTAVNADFPLLYFCYGSAVHASHGFVCPELKEIKFD
jgi:hypothetical protein